MKTKYRYISKGAMILGLALILLFPVEILAQETLSELLDQATASGIDQDRITEVQNRLESRGLSEEEFMTILRPAIEMADDKLPYEMIFEKVFEGLSKGVPVQRMTPVLSLIRENSLKSAQLVDQWMAKPEVDQFFERGDSRLSKSQYRNEMVKAGSMAIAQNVDEEVLRETLNSVGDGNMERVRPSGILAAINILSDLPNGAASASENARIVLKALQSGFEAGDIQKLPAAMNMAQRRSQLPAAAVGEGLMQQLERGLPSEKILQNMFNGEIGGGPPGNIPNNRRGRPGGN